MSIVPLKRILVNAYAIATAKRLASAVPVRTVPLYAPEMYCQTSENATNSLYLQQILMGNYLGRY